MSKSYTDKILDKIIDFAELGRFIDNPVRTYSSGMYMRLAFSVAIHVEPQILLIDEILAVGDADFQNKCFKRIDEFRRSGVTIVIVSHDLDSLRKLCSKLYWLENGRIYMQGPPDKVISAYKAVHG